MRVSLVAAVADNGVIGHAGALPWHIPSDLAHFKKITMGKPIIMGRKTHQSIGRPLPGRLNIVLSRDQSFRRDGVTCVATLDDALQAARQSGSAEAMIIGGGEIYRLAWVRADRVYLTAIHASVPGDTRFPSADWSEWRELERVDVPPAGSVPAFSFITLERTRAAG